MKSLKIRMLDWLMVALALSLVIFALYPAQIPVSIYKINLIALGGFAGYWIDRSLFPYARPDRFYPSDRVGGANDPDAPLQYDIDAVIQNDLLFAVAQIRRAVIVAACMVAVGIGA